MKVLVCVLAALTITGVISAQMSISVESEVFARAFDDPGAGFGDLISLEQGPLPGVSFRHEVMESNPQLSSPSAASSELFISQPQNVRPSSDPELFLYDIDVVGELTRTTPQDFFPGTAATASLEIVFSTGGGLTDGLPLFFAGSASYASNQSGVGSLASVPAFEILSRSSSGDVPLTQLMTDEPTSGSISLPPTSIAVFPSDLVLRAQADISDQLSFDDGTSEVSFDFTLTFLGPIPAPSSAALFGVAAVVAARRRRSTN